MSLKVKNVKIWKRILSVLLVMTMLGSVASPVLAVNTAKMKPIPTTKRLETAKYTLGLVKYVRG
jgi:uncharacterized surface anchored protein